MKKDGLAKYSQCHECCPKDWRKTHDITGSHELDAVIEKSKNGDMRAKLSDWISSDEAYGPLTAYSGYSNYRGDS